ncbi:hypothetical protein EAF00_007689 [Botryotinia globosa]|nr:hypothetical protein EAF00_007689 [Botryotinia globosa]
MPEFRESRIVKADIEYICPKNADTLAIIAGGLWFNDKAQCNRVPPIGLVAAPPPTLKYKDKRQSTGDAVNKIALDPPYDGYGFASIFCDNPDSNGCCGECANPTSTSISVSKISTTSIPSSTVTSAPASITSASPSSLTSITGALPCLMHEDPDAGTPPVCQCSNVVNAPPVTGTNTAGQTGKYCPWTTLPTQAMMTTKPSAPTDHCCSISVYLYGFLWQSKGSTAVIFNPPTASMEMGSSKVNVGTSMTGEALFTSVSNALTSLCTTPTSSGAWTSCQTGTIELGDATWLNDNSREDGKVTIKVIDAQYNTTDYLDMVIHMIASTGNATATGNNCKLLDWEEISWRKRDAFTSNGPQEPTTSTMESRRRRKCGSKQFDFDLGELDNFDCASSVDLVGEVLGNVFDAIFPEIIWLIETGVKLGEIACDAAETFNPTRLLLRDPETSIVDEKLAKAWAKEIKKERMLPIPEHKNRELGLLR